MLGLHAGKFEIIVPLKLSNRNQLPDYEATIDDGAREARRKIRVFKDMKVMFYFILHFKSNSLLTFFFSFFSIPCKIPSYNDGVCEMGEIAPF